MDETLSRTQQFTVPAGRMVLVVVGISSAEFDEWTDPATSQEYNDLLEWEVRPATGQTIDGSIDVNSRHLQWLAARAGQNTLPGLNNVAHIEQIEVLEAPDDADLVVDITLRATNIGDEKLPSDIAVGLVPVGLIPDANRDGVIDDADRGKATRTKPWRFWINDDEDSASNPNDIPQGPDSSGIDGKNLRVDGLRDMVDFFPAHPDLRSVLRVLPPAKFRYRLTHPHSTEFPALRVVFAPELDPAAAAAYLKSLPVAYLFQNAESRAAHTAGPRLEEPMLEAIESGRGLMLIEGVKPTSSPLRLKIEHIGRNETLVEFRRDKRYPQQYVRTLMRAVPAARTSHAPLRPSDL